MNKIKYQKPLQPHSENDVISSDHSYVYKAGNPEEAEDQDVSDQHSREANLMTDEGKTEDNPMDLEDNKTVKLKAEGKTRNKKKGIIYNPLVYHTNTTGKTYYYKYFKTYAYDYRMLQNDEQGEPIKCHCPSGKIHHVKCPWFHPDIIYIIDVKEDLSPSELAAQQKIYNIYQNTVHNPPEQCGCGTAAEIAYMGHHTGCVEFQYIHERESYEVLFAILKKRKKVTFSEHTNIQSK